MAAVVLYATTFRVATLSRPFDYDAEGAGSVNAVLARSYLRFDWSQSHGMPILSLDPERAPSIVFYPDHPPLVPLIIVPFYKLFGVGEWQTRAPIALTTILAIVMLYRLLCAFDGPGTAIVACAVFAAMPMTLYFGGFADVVGMPLVLLSLLAVDRYVRFQRAPGTRTFVWLVVAFAAAGICDWPAYVLAPIFVAHFIVTRPRRQWKWAAAFAAVACGVFVILYVYITIATQSPWSWMADLFARRSVLIGARAYSWQQWLAAAGRVNSRYQTWPVIACAIAWTTLYAWGGASGGATVARLLLAWAALYAIIGSKALFDHEWAWMLFTPGLVVTAALLLARVPAVASACAIVAFAAWTTYTSFWSLYPSPRDRPFTPMQTAAALRVAAPAPCDVVLLVGNEDEAQLWFYADRPLRSGIWSIDDFHRRVDDDNVDLMFNFDTQPWKARATGIVFPRIWAQRFAAFHEFLEQTYPRLALPTGISTLFDAYDLRTTARQADQPDARVLQSRFTFER
jgi:hypothetical protein